VPNVSVITQLYSITKISISTTYFGYLTLAIFRFGYMCQRKTTHTMQYRLEPSKDYTRWFKYDRD